MDDIRVHKERVEAAALKRIEERETERVKAQQEHDNRLKKNYAKLVELRTHFNDQTLEEDEQIK